MSQRIAQRYHIRCPTGPPRRATGNTLPKVAVAPLFLRGLVSGAVPNMLTGVLIALEIYEALTVHAPAGPALADLPPG